MHDSEKYKKINISKETLGVNVTFLLNTPKNTSYTNQSICLLVEEQNISGVFQPVQQ